MEVGEGRGGGGRGDALAHDVIVDTAFEGVTPSSTIRQAGTLNHIKRSV